MRKTYLLFRVLLMSVMFVGLERADAQTPTPTPTPTAPPSIAAGYYFNDSVAGQKITIPGTFTDVDAGTVLLKAIESGRSRDEKVTIAGDKNSLSFDLPTDLESGRYKVRLTLSGKNGAGPPLEMPSELRIPVPPALQVSVAKVQPISPYPNPAHADYYDFEIAGTNFASELANNSVEINGVPLTLRTGTDCTRDYKNPCLRVEPGSETRKLIVEGYQPPGFSHPLEVGVRVGKGANVAKAQDALIFSSISKTRLQIYAVGTFFLIIGIVFLLVRVGIKLRRKGGQSFGSLRAFLIDKETNSYSLSKLQLMTFTLVTVFGYIYVFVCRMFVQWKFEMPDVPEGLPTMMGVSVGTSVVAAGIGARIGGKGAGPESPSLADFITSGGVVLPERFQFFLWTIVSSAGVLALILASDPVTINQLPKLPDGMLYLMGLSSAGYLGGKLVRGPGPSIKSVDASRVDVPAKPAQEGKPKIDAYTGLQLTLTGDNLSPDCTFSLDDEQIPADQVLIVGQDGDPQHKQFAHMLKVHLKNVAERYFEGPHVLRIVNPDSQGADFTFGTTIESVSTVPAGQNEIPVTVTGTNFKDPSKAEWTPAGGAATPIAEEKITKKSDTELEILLIPGASGTGELAIISPGGIQTTVEVPVG